MAGTQRFKTWNIFDGALLDIANGHHYWETKGLVDELLRRGETVRVFSHRQAPPAERFSGVTVVPLFSLTTYWNLSNDPTWSKLENFIVQNRCVSQDLSRLDPSLFEDSLVLFPTVMDNQILGIVRWLATFSESSAPMAAICLVPPRALSNTDHTAGLYKTVWKDCSPGLKNRIALFGRTPQVAELLANHAQMPARVFPYPIPEDLAAARQGLPAPSDGDLLVSFVGGTREARGGALIPDVVRQCAGSGVRFFIQAQHGGDTDIDEGGLTALSHLPNVTVHQGALERKDYYRAIADSAVLLAYRPENYRFRDSGVYHEARFLDAPVLVSAGTFMADEVKSLGNGLVIEEFSVAAIVDCIARAQRELPALKAAAVRVGKEARERQGLARCIDAIAGAFDDA